MSPTRGPRIGVEHGRIWGARTRDWANTVEPMMRPVYETVFARIGLASGMDYLTTRSSLRALCS